jgi:N-acetylmuramoyl-L-alanine amidase
MEAVATCVMNRTRVTYGEYARTGRGSIRRVIEQPGQFTCMMTTVGGVPNPQNVWAATPEAIHFEVADWAINGGIHSGVGSETLWYMNPFRPQCPNFFPYNRTGYWFRSGMSRSRLFGPDRPLARRRERYYLSRDRALVFHSSSIFIPRFLYINIAANRIFITYSFSAHSPLRNLFRRLEKYLSLDSTPG